MDNLCWKTHAENIKNKRSRFIKHRGKAIVVFWTDGSVTAYSARKYCPIPLTTLSHLLHVDTPNGQHYRGSSRKYGIERAFFFDEVPSEYQKRLGILENFGKNKKNK